MPRNPNEKIPYKDPKAPNEMGMDLEERDEEEDDDEDEEKEEKKPKSKDGAPWLTAEELIEVKKNIEASIKYQKAENRWDHWHEYLDYLNCRWDNSYDDDGPHCNVNTAFSNLQTELPTLYFQHPDVNVLAKRPKFFSTTQTPQGPIKVEIDNIQGAKLLGVRLNNVFLDIIIEPVIERGIVDALAPYGYCTWKVGYGLTTEFDRVLNQEVDKTTYWVRRVDPRNILVDPLAPSFNEREYTVERLIRRKKSIENNPLYLKRVIKDLPTKIPDTYKNKCDSIGSDYDPKLIEFFEYHDHVKKTVHWVSIDKNCVEIRKPIKKKVWLEGSDYVFLDLNVATDDSAYPLSDIEPVIDQMKARNRIRSAQCKHLENWGISVFVEGEFWSDDEQEEIFKSVGNGVGIYKVKTDAINQNRMIVQPPPPIPPDLYSMDQVHKQDNDQTLGITDAMQGQATGSTKAEVMTVNNASNVRIARRRRKIKLAIIEIAKKLAALIREHDDAATVLNIAGLMDDDDFVSFIKKMDPDFNPEVPFLETDKTAWQGEYNFDFEIEEMLERPKAVQIQQTLNTITQLAQLAQIDPRYGDELRETVDPKHVFRQLFELQGMHVEALKKQSLKPEIPAGIENDLADQGIEIPPPHKKNDHTRHIVEHLGLMKEMQSKLPFLMQAALDPATGQPKNPEAMQAYLQVKKAIQFLQQHVVEHYKMDQGDVAKNLASLAGTGMGGPSMKQAPVNGPSVPSQLMPPAPPGPPDPVTMAQNAGAGLPMGM